MLSGRKLASWTCALLACALASTLGGRASAFSLPQVPQDPPQGELQPVPAPVEPPGLAWPDDLEIFDALPESGASEPSDEPAGPGPLLFPVAGGRQTGLEKHFLSRRGRRLHHALDIVAPRNTPIRAVADGTIVRLHRSRRGGIGVEQMDVSGEYCFYYAHLQRYAPGLKVGQSVSRDDLLGFVGSTGRAVGPHLHFQVMKLDANGDCWLGSTPIDPYPLLELQRAAPFHPAEPGLEAE